MNKTRQKNSMCTNIFGSNHNFLRLNNMITCTARHINSTAHHIHYYCLSHTLLLLITYTYTACHIHLHCQSDTLLLLATYTYTASHIHLHCLSHTRLLLFNSDTFSASTSLSLASIVVFWSLSTQIC